MEFAWLPSRANGKTNTFHLRIKAVRSEPAEITFGVVQVQAQIKLNVTAFTVSSCKLIKIIEYTVLFRKAALQSFRSIISAVQIWRKPLIHSKEFM